MRWQVGKSSGNATASAGDWATIATGASWLMTLQTLKRKKEFPKFRNLFQNFGNGVSTAPRRCSQVASAGR
jgi:hypothetical protein